MGEALLGEGVAFPAEVARSMGSREFMDSIAGSMPDSGSVLMWFLGQNSFILKDESGTTIAIDPYLSDYCATGPVTRGPPPPRNERSRILPLFIEPGDLDVDWILITHSHCDHADSITLAGLDRGKRWRVAAPWAASKVALDAGVPGDRVRVVNPGEEFELGPVKAKALFAEPTDPGDVNHLGYLLRFACGKAYYNSGDTAASPLLLAQARSLGAHWMSVCINAGYGNLSHWQAAELVRAVEPRYAVPCHYDMMPHNLCHPAMFRKSLATLGSAAECVVMPYYQARAF